MSKEELKKRTDTGEIVAMISTICLLSGTKIGINLYHTNLFNEQKLNIVLIDSFHELIIFFCLSAALIILKKFGMHRIFFFMILLPYLALLTVSWIQTFVFKKKSINLKKISIQHSIPENDQQKIINRLLLF